MRYLVTLAFCLIAINGAASQEKTAGIPVVKTWKDLQDVAPIDIGDGVKIHLGLEADKLPQWSGGLLYCLTEGYTPANGGDGAQPFGPVHAAFDFGDSDVEIKREKSKVIWGSAKKNWPKASYLFARGLAVDRVGKYYIRVTDSKDKLLAKATLEGTKDAFHPWMPWQKGYDKPIIPAKGIAVPTVDQIGPIAFIEAGKTKKDRLQTFWPDDTKPTLKLRKDVREFVLSADKDFTTSRPDYHLLARWWVNDKPFVPKQNETLWDYAGYGRVLSEKEMRLSPAFRPERFDANPGDKIGLQLMHCEGQWTWCTSSYLGKSGRASKEDGENVRLSNRIEFVVPKAK
jgi:hypothetical protein